MLKLAKRTAQAEKQAARKERLKQRALDAIEGNRRSQVRTLLKEEIFVQTQQARRLRREKWTLGPLAPQRNHAGSIADPIRRGRSSVTNNYGNEMFSSDMIPHWGSISVRRIRNSGGPLTPKDIENRCAWAGTPKRLCLAVGDRAVVMEGTMKGQIAAIKDVKPEEGIVTLEGIGRINVTVPEAMIAAGDQSVQQVEASIPIDAIRLVHPLTDPATGITRDVIIRELRAQAFQMDRVTRRLTFTRVVPGLNVRIPWPRQERPVEYQDEPSDTLRIDTEQVTFVPTLLRPPAPEAVLDELRNKYSRFRTRHTADYIAEKEGDAAAKKEANKYGSALVKRQQPGVSPPSMRTPLEEFHIQQKALRKERGQPELTDEMLEKIGRIMARTKISALENAGITEIPTQSAASQEPPSSSPPS